MFGFGRKKELSLSAPVAGNVIPVSAVNDATFSNDILGRGIAILPAAGKIASPAGGTIRMMFETGHALSMETESGIELLIHVGIDTVKLKGRHFTKHKNTGDVVEAGEPLLSFDPAAIREAGYDPVTILVVLNPGEFSSIRFAENESIQPGDPLVTLVRANH